MVVREKPAEMYDLYLASGGAVFTAGILTSLYLIYSIYRTSTARIKRTAYVTLSETLASVAIGGFFIYFYSILNQDDGTQNMQKYGEKYISNTTDNNSTNACNFCEELWMQHALLVVSLAHCFVTLITTGVQCQKCLKCEVEILKTVEPSTSEEKSKTEPKINPYMEVMRNDFSVILLQWIIPILTVLLMCVSADVFKIKKQENKVDDFQMFITEALEHPMNITSNAQYKQDVDNIVSRVYSIIEQVNNNQTFEQAGPKPEDIFSIIEMLDVKTREPKMMKNDEMKEDNFSFKLYTLFFAVFDYLIPLMYSNVMYFKSKMCLKLRQNKTNEKERNDLSLNTNYLKLSIILATVLWTPSFVEFLSRTFLTNEQPNLVTEGLIATGSSYMIARNGINLKAIKNLINQSNNILPIGKS